MISALALVFVVCSAIAWYAASPHCMWSALRGHPRVARVAGGVLTLLSLACWISVSGMAAGLCVTLVSAMLALMAQPWLAALLGTPDADATAAEKE